MDSIWSNPVRVFTLGSFSHSSQVNLMSALVSGSPSDHLMPFWSVQVTSILSPFTTTPPLATSGTLVTSVGTYVPSFAVSTSPSTVLLMTTPRIVWLPYGAPSVDGSCQIAMIAVPPRWIWADAAALALGAPLGAAVGAPHAVATNRMANASVRTRFMWTSPPARTPSAGRPTLCA